MLSSKITAATAERILDVAERLAQTRGYNGFSYADIAAEIGITKASLHYHFPTKAILGLTLVERYTERFSTALDAVGGGAEPAATKLVRYVALYRDVLVLDRLCLCAMFAAEITTLPESIQDAVRRFFEVNERWLVEVLTGGMQAGELSFDGDPRVEARALAAALDGAMLLARSFEDDSRFDSVAERVLSTLVPRE